MAPSINVEDIQDSSDEGEGPRTSGGLEEVAKIAAKVLKVVREETQVPSTRETKLSHST